MISIPSNTGFVESSDGQLMIKSILTIRTNVDMRTDELTLQGHSHWGFSWCRRVQKVEGGQVKRTHTRAIGLTTVHSVGGLKASVDESVLLRSKPTESFRTVW